MEVLICPNCGKPVSYHGDEPDDSWLRLLTGEDIHCPYNEVMATKQAQRAAACKHLKELGRKARDNSCVWHGECLYLSHELDRIYSAIEAYRAVGILKSKRDA